MFSFLCTLGHSGTETCSITSDRHSYVIHRAEQRHTHANSWMRTHATALMHCIFCSFFISLAFFLPLFLFWFCTPCTDTHSAPSCASLIVYHITLYERPFSLSRSLARSLSRSLFVSYCLVHHNADIIGGVAGRWLVGGWRYGRSQSADGALCQSALQALRALSLARDHYSYCRAFECQDIMKMYRVPDVRLASLRSPSLSFSRSLSL